MYFTHLDKKKINSLIDKWFREFNFLFTLTEDYNQLFLDFVYQIVDNYIKENDLRTIDERLMWGHIRYILGNTYKSEIETYKTKIMLKDKHKNIVRDIILLYRPDLQKELLHKESYIYDRIEEDLSKNDIPDINRISLERAWMNINLEDPIPNLTSEIDILFEIHYPELKKEFSGLAMYNNTLIEIGNSTAAKEVYTRYNYLTDDFFYTDEFSENLLEVITAYLEEQRHI